LDGSQLPPAKSKQDRVTYCWSQNTERESSCTFELTGNEDSTYFFTWCFILDSELNFESHIRNVTKIAFLPPEEHCQGVAVLLSV
jgi:hypothetical protein